ncbi:unnamed protein product [Polarella glacialis]|uniref:Cytochrome P450 n=1 Tax=Polarella glacialis TaxID=89957 RepID=A0A813F6K9_POLGL|nr:unnamed protein product [Polarella glacialis]
MSLELCDRLRQGITNLSWREAAGLFSFGLFGKVLWSHYGILRHHKLPQHDLGWPLIGHTLSIFRDGIDTFVDSMMKGRKAVLCNFLFTHAVLIDYPVYLEHIHRDELDGKLSPKWIPSMATLMGKSSILALPGGKGHALHKRLRSKILHSLASKPVLAILPQILSLTREMLDGLAAKTEENGFASFEGPAAELASKVSTLQITAGLDQKLQESLHKLLDDVLQGMFSLPLNLGRFTAFGRGCIARREINGIIKDVMQSPNLDHQNIIKDLMHTSESGEAFTAEEISDTVVTLLLAGKLTTADAMPALLVRLHEHPEWVTRIAEETLEFKGIEEDSSTLRAVRESLRLVPPAGAYRRVCPHAALDLGEHGRIPAGCAFSVLIRNPLRGMGPAFEPERWTPEKCRQDGNLAFGGSEPHSCIGKNLALLELQVFASLLCKEYSFQALDPELVMKSSNPISKTYKDSLRVQVSKKVCAVVA